MAQDRQDIDDDDQSVAGFELGHDPANDLIAIWLQCCTPAPPRGGAMPTRIPGAQATQAFQRAAYAVTAG